MPQTTLINRFGKIAGWNSKKVNILGRNIEGITKIQYTDNQEMNPEYGAGGYPVGYSEGNYQATASVTLFMEEIIALQKSLTPGLRLQDIPPFDIVVSYTYNNMLVKDIIRNCKFKNNGREVGQGEGKVLVEMELLCSHIQWAV
jgi:hypothetical protein